MYGIQFHPRSSTRRGDILRNFVVGIAGARTTWTRPSFVETTVAGIRERVGDGKVICALSGGVDSAVAATLVHRAIGDQLTCIYVDHGLMRKRESELLRATFAENLGMQLVMVDARERFLKRLAGVEDPEEKRRIIGDEFIRVFEEEAAKLGQIDFLTQGTLYPDVIESKTAETKTAAKIKTHHNVGGPPTCAQPDRRCAPVRKGRAGRRVSLPAAAVPRVPASRFGSSARTADRLETLREADWIVIDETGGWPVSVPGQSPRSHAGALVGVMGDFRTTLTSSRSGP